MLDTRRQLPERYPYGNSSNGHLLGQQISEPCPAQILIATLPASA